MESVKILKVCRYMKDSSLLLETITKQSNSKSAFGPCVLNIFGRSEAGTSHGIGRTPPIRAGCRSTSEQMPVMKLVQASNLRSRVSRIDKGHRCPKRSVSGNRLGFNPMAMDTECGVEIL